MQMAMGAAVLPAQLGRVGMHEALPRYAREFGPVCKAFFGRFPIVVITDADLVKQVRGAPALSPGSRPGLLLRLRTLHRTASNGMHTRRPRPDACSSSRWTIAGGAADIRSVSLALERHLLCVPCAALVSFNLLSSVVGAAGVHQAVHAFSRQARPPAPT